MELDILIITIGHVELRILKMIHNTAVFFKKEEKKFFKY